MKRKAKSSATEKATALLSRTCQMSPSLPSHATAAASALALSPPESILPPASSPSTSALPACTTPSTRLIPVRKEGKRGEGGWLEAGRRLQRSLVGHAYNWTEKQRDLLVEDDPQPGVRWLLLYSPVPGHPRASRRPSLRTVSSSSSCGIMLAGHPHPACCQARKATLGAEKDAGSLR